MGIYNSYDPAHKTPFGAAATNETITFTLHLPQEWANTNPVLRLWDLHHESDPLILPLARLDDTRWQCRFTPTHPALYAYDFALGDRGILRRSEDGESILNSHAERWQLTVYDAAMRCPAFLGGGVMYQIFPDRFCASNKQKQTIPTDRLLRSDWEGIPLWRPDDQGEVTNRDYFGGDLDGIRQKLPYLASLGVTVLYLNPIFEAHSNHRYNTANYANIDPMLGNETDFRTLCAAAKEHGIHILLDGVFSHTGSDSLYFNKEKRYGDGGAFHDPGSPYRVWYCFHDDPQQYDCWWGFSTLPNVNEEEPSYLEFICGENGILRKWLAAGASGFRLDVADELPDGFLDRLRECVKGFSPDAAIIGEVWEDASNKVSYGVRRRYLLGRQLDSVMNYPFMYAILDYIRWGSHRRLYNTIMQILEHYPPPVIRALMNSLSTHDTVRAITALAGPLMENHDREWQEQNHILSPKQYSHGCGLFKLACVLQFGLPGMPCIYYGDEAGMCGYKDPFNRCGYPWGNENTSLIEFLRTLGMVRQHYPLADATFLPLKFTPEICSFVRQGKNFTLLFAVNRTHQTQILPLPSGYSARRCPALTGTYTDGVLGPYSGVVMELEHGKHLESYSFKNS